MTCPVSHSKISVEIEYSQGHMFLKALAPSIAHDRISQAFILVQTDLHVIFLIACLQTNKSSLSQARYCVPFISGLSETDTES